jgi:hypothetical protein
VWFGLCRRGGNRGQGTGDRGGIQVGRGSSDGGVRELGKAEEEGGGAAHGFAGAAALFEGGDALGVDGDVGDLGVGVLDGAGEGGGDGGELGRCDKTGAAGRGGLEGSEALGDVIAREEEGELGEGGAAGFGDVAEGEVGVGEVVDEAVDLSRGGGEGGCRGWGGRLEHAPIVRQKFGVSIGF